MKQTMRQEILPETLEPGQEMDEAIRNAITSLGADASMTGLLTRVLLGQNKAVCLKVLAARVVAMEADGEITRLSTGAYVLGNHVLPAAEELRLQSTDPQFGQMALF